MARQLLPAGRSSRAPTPGSGATAGGRRRKGVAAERLRADWGHRGRRSRPRRQLRRSATEARLLLLEPVTMPEPPPGGEAWSLVADLPIRQRTAVVLRHVVGLTESQIADAMGVTRSTVSSALASAHRTLGR